MFRSKRFILLVLVFLFINNNSVATIYWVGDSANCTGSNIHASLALATFASAFSSSAADEIRLTDTINYVGNLHGDLSLSNYNSFSAGELTIRGGYTDCFSAATNSRTFMGNTGNSIVSVFADTVSTAITLKNLNLVNGAFRGIVATGNVAVHLENVRIADNQSGMFVTNGAGVIISADSIIENNDKSGLTGNGGGIECKDANSYVELSGILKNNAADKGGNLYIGNGCFAVLNGGSVIQGGAGTDSFEGGGVYVNNGGELLSNGGASRVLFENNDAGFGGGIFVLGTGKATLLNTFFRGNYAGKGIIYAKDGGPASIQVKMDRAASCPFLISCSQIDNNLYLTALIYAENSVVEINRTIILRNDLLGVVNNSDNQTFALAINNGEIRLNRVAMFNHDDIRHLTINDSTSKIKMTHVTVANNTYQFEGAGPILNAFINLSTGELSIENSIFSDTQGLDPRVGTFSASCNLVDNSTNWPSGTFHIGTPIFNNLAGGDPRQTSDSPGVDMCLQDSFAWSTENDIENQVSPVNDSTNQQGNPGHPDGMYDAGFDEVYNNIGNDEFLLMVQKQGSGQGTVLSTPVGISCGSDCSEVYFNGTLVTLFAVATMGSSFIGWSGCPLANGDECFTSVEANHTIIANFQTQEELIFANGFE